MSLKTHTLGELFTAKQLRRAKAIILVTQGLERRDRLVKEVVAEALPRINEVTGQENEPAYLAYVLEWALDR